MTAQTATSAEDLVTVPTRRPDWTGDLDDADLVRVPREAADHWDARLWHDRPGMMPA